VAPFLTVAVGGALLIWLMVQFAIVGYSNDPPLQPIYLGLGIVITLVGVAWLRQAGLRFVGILVVAYSFAMATYRRKIS
jgi:hypothetical protein